MAENKNITMKQYNGTDYDVLYPKTKVSQVDGAVASVNNVTPDNTGDVKVDTFEQSIKIGKNVDVGTDGGASAVQFHFDGNSNAYTSRIVESENGVLTVDAILKLNQALGIEFGGTGAATQDGAGKNLLDLGYINGDLDDMTSIGASWCDFSYCTNAPFSSGYGYVIRDYASGTVTQTAFRHDIGMIYRRSHVNGAWTKWRNSFDVGTVTATTYPPEAGIYVVTGAKIFQNMTPHSLQGVLVIFHAGYAAHLYIDSSFNLYYGFSGNTFAEPTKWYTPSVTQQS